VFQRKLFAALPEGQMMENNMNFARQARMVSRAVVAGLLFLAFTVSAYAQNGKHLGKIAIRPFSGGSVDEQEGIAELLSFTPEMKDNFIVITRTGITGAAEQEQTFQALSGMTDEKTIVDFANQFGADYVMAGSITSLGNRHLLIVSVIKIDEIRQVAGDYLVYDSLDALSKDEKILNAMADNLVEMARGRRDGLDELALLPVEFSEGANEQEGEALAQLLAIYLLRVGKYAVYPQMATLDDVQKEYETQLLGGATQDSEQVKVGKAVNPKYVLSVVSRKIASGMRFNASIIDLAGGYQIAGKSEQYANLSDGMNAMGFLARELSGVEVSGKERSGRTDMVTKEQEALERAAAAAEAARKRAAAMDQFLNNSGIAFSGCFGFGLGSSTGSFLGSGHIELRLNRYFGIQTGVSVFTDYAPYTPSGKEEQHEKLTIVQIPVLARVNFGYLEGWRIAVFAGAGLNAAVKTSDAESADPGRLDIIFGGDLGFHGRNFALTLVGYRWSGISSSSFTVDRASYDYTRSSHILYFGANYYLPFRKWHE
jgi:TolB-like protein